MLVLALGPEAGGRLDWPSLRTDLKETASGARRALKERPRRTLAWDTPDHVPTWYPAARSARAKDAGTTRLSQSTPRSLYESRRCVAAWVSSSELVGGCV